MSRYSLFIDKKTQYCQDVCSSQIDQYNLPETQYNPCQRPYDNMILQFIQRGKRLRIPTQDWEKQSWRTGVLNFKTHYKATGIKIA